MLMTVVLLANGRPVECAENCTPTEAIEWAAFKRMEWAIHTPGVEPEILAHFQLAGEMVDLTGDDVIEILASEVGHA